MINTIKNRIYALLRKSERWTKTDMVYLARGGFWLSTSKIVGSATALILAIAYANLLPKESYATYKYILSFAAIITIPTLLGMTSSLTKSIAQGFDASFYDVLRTKLRWSSLAFLIGAAISLYYYLRDNPELALGFLIIALISPLIESLNIYGSYLQGKKLFKQVAIINNIKTITLTLSILAILFFSKNIIFILFSNYFLALLFAITAFFIITKKYKFNDRKDPSTISYGKHLSLMSVLGTVSGQIDKILTWHFLGPVALAVYSFATIPVMQIESFFKSVPILAFPKIANQDSETIKKSLPKKILIFSAVLAVITLIYIISAPFLFKIFFPQYLESVKYSQLFSLMLIFYPFRMIYHALMAKQQKKSLYTIQIISPLIRIALFVILLPAFGVYGLIFATLLSLTIDTAYSLYFFYKI